MLVLSRKRDEKIILGEGEITIVVVDIRSDKVRLGIKAPADISVHREEIFRIKQREAAQRKEDAKDSEVGTSRPEVE